ncbi:hypothetical protein AWENTII_000509 [Aspergillus wentii]
MGRGGYNAPAQSTEPSHPVSSFSSITPPPVLLRMQGRGGYNDIHDDDDQSGDGRASKGLVHITQDGLLDGLDFPA